MILIIFKIQGRVGGTGSHATQPFILLVTTLLLCVNNFWPFFMGCVPGSNNQMTLTTGKWQRYFWMSPYVKPEMKGRPVRRESHATQPIILLVTPLLLCIDNFWLFSLGCVPGSNKQMTLPPWKMETLFMNVPLCKAWDERKAGRKRITRNSAIHKTNCIQSQRNMQFKQI